MSMIDFVRNMTSDNVPNMIIYSFDEIMVLYSFIGTKQDIEICYENNGDNRISFTLLMESVDKAKDLCSQLCGRTFTVHGRTYTITMNRSKANVITKITRVELI